MSVQEENFDKNSHQEEEYFADQNAQNESTQENSEVSEESIVSELEQELSAQKDKYVRLMAEFENYKRRTSAERKDIVETAGKDIVVSLLDVLDDMDRAESQMENDTDVKHLKEGVNLIFNKFRNILAARGVKSIDTQNQEFDTELHEAVANVPVQDETQKGKVIDELQKGYTLGNKIIRFPKVVVGN